jgi:hypothetical protein
MQCKVYDVFYSITSHQHVLAATEAIFCIMLILREYKGTNVISYVSVTPKQLKIIKISVTFT